MQLERNAFCSLSFRKETHAGDNYMDLLPRRTVVVPIYTELENEYEEMEELNI